MYHAVLHIVYLPSSSCPTHNYIIWYCNIYPQDKSIDSNSDILAKFWWHSGGIQAKFWKSLLTIRNPHQKHNSAFPPPTPRTTHSTPTGSSTPACRSSSTGWSRRLKQTLLFIVRYYSTISRRYHSASLFLVPYYCTTLILIIWFSVALYLWISKLIHFVQHARTLLHFWYDICGFGFVNDSGSARGRENNWKEGPQMVAVNISQVIRGGFSKRGYSRFVCKSTGNVSHAIRKWFTCLKPSTTHRLFIRISFANPPRKLRISFAKSPQPPLLC